MNPIRRRRTGGTLAFTPTALFAGNKAGAWLDINDLSRGYTLYNGSTNLAAINDPIGRVETKAGTQHAFNATSSQRPFLKQWPNSGRYHAYHDRVDDKLTLAAMPAGIVTLGMATFAGVQIYETVHEGDVFSLPAADYTEIVIREGSLSLSEWAMLQSYLATKTPVIGPTDVFRLYCSSNSVNLSVTETSPGAAGITWELGDGQTASGASCVKTIVAPQHVIMRAVDPSKITIVNWNSKSLFGQADPFAVCPGLNIFYCSINGLTGRIPSINSATIQLLCHTNQFTGYAPVFSVAPNLNQIVIHTNFLTGSIPPLSNNPLLTSAYFNTNNFIGSIPSLSANPVLAIARFNNNQLTGYDGGTFSATLGDFQAQNNLLPASAVNAILAAFVAAGRTSASGTCTLNLGGTGNAAPTGQGITDKATLISRGWTCTTN